MSFKICHPLLGTHKNFINDTAYLNNSFHIVKIIIIKKSSSVLASRQSSSGMTTVSSAYYLDCISRLYPNIPSILGKNPDRHLEFYIYI